MSRFWACFFLASALINGCGPFQEAVQPGPESPAIQLKAYGNPSSNEKIGPTAVIGTVSWDEEKEGSAQPKQKITLPMAIEMCINNNFRVLAGAQRIGIAEADLITASLIPNSSLFADCQLIPLRHVDIDNQLGPPQWDTLVSIPIDWLLFGKRVAAMRAARLGVDVSAADSADVLRTQLAQTVDAFYEVLMDDAYFKLSEKNLEELTELEKLTVALGKDKKAGALDLDRIKLAVHEALLERHDRELALDLAKARLRPYLGRTAADPDYEVDGALTVTAVVPPPKLEEAVALAEVNRPDLLSGRLAIDQANATVQLERRRAKPQVSIQPGWSYQDQAHQSLFHNGSMFEIGISTGLPLTDRNQGNIRKAQVQVAERRFTYQGDRADALAEVESAVSSYDDAVEHLTQFNTVETLQAANDLRKNMEAAYRNGDRKLIELLDAHKAYIDRLGHVIEFESFYWRSLNKLNAAVGLKAYDPEKGPTKPVGEVHEPKK
jgi:cobalt-zinc-cadmium efflux system outer membrane protein